MRRKRLICLVVALVGLLTQGLVAQTNEAGWRDVLMKMGVEKGRTLPADAYDTLMKRLVAFPPVAEKIRQSATKPITLDEWIKTMKGLGINPKPSMTGADWTQILAASGVDVSRGATAPALTEAPKFNTPVAAAVAAGAGVAAVAATRSDPTPSAQTTADSAPVSPVIASTPTITSSNTVSAPAVVQTSSTVPVSPSTTTATTSVAVPAIPEPVGTSTAPVQVQWTTVVSTQPAHLESTSTAKLINLDLRGMDIQEVLKIFSKQGALNFVSSPNVRGNVTMTLKAVPIWDALRLVCESNDLAFAYDGTIVRVLSATEYEKLYGLRFDDKTQVETLSLQNVKAAALAKFMEPLKSRVGKVLVYDYSNALVLIDTPEALKRMKDLALNLDQKIETWVFPLNYAKADEILPKVSNLITKDIGTAEIDKRTNRLVVSDFPDRVRSIRMMIKAFDQKHRVVLIEAKIIQVNLNDEFRMGVNWQYVFDHIGNNIVGGAIAGPFSIPSGAGTPFSVSLGNLTDNKYTALLQMFESIGKTNLVSAPRIAALNNEPANILVGTREAYVTTTVTNPGGGAPSTTAEQVNFVDVGVKLHLTATIGEDDFVTLRLKPEVSSVDRTINTSQGNIIPIVRTSQVETSIVVKDGETVLLGGLIEDQDAKSKGGIPILARIPLLGIPFRNQSRKTTKSEMTILLTPHLMPDDGKAVAGTVTEKDKRGPS